MKFLIPLILALALSASPASAITATITQVHGDIFYSGVTDLLKAQDEVVIKTGDRVISMKDSNARITFHDGCVYTLNQRSSILIPELTPCEGGVMSQVDVVSSDISNKETWLLIGTGAAAVFILTTESDETISP